MPHSLEIVPMMRLIFKTFMIWRDRSRARKFMNSSFFPLTSAIPKLSVRLSVTLHRLLLKSASLSIVPTFHFSRS